LEAKVGVADDPVFGPVITFGQGGTAGDLMGDSVVGLPPLNMNLAREMISRTRIAKLLQTSGDAPAAAMQALYLTLVQLSQLIVDLPAVAALEINPLVVDHRGAVALGASDRASDRASQGWRPPARARGEIRLTNGLRCCCGRSGRRTPRLSMSSRQMQPAGHKCASVCERCRIWKWLG
jgi:acetyltransferase